MRTVEEYEKMFIFSVTCGLSLLPVEAFQKLL